MKFFPDSSGDRTQAGALPRLFLVLATMAGSMSACTDQPAGFFPGYAEADYVRLASPIAGTLTRLYLKRGDKAETGAPAFVLEQENERAARDEAAYRVQRAIAQLANLKKGRRPEEIAAINAQLAQVQAALTLSLADLKRQQELAAAKFQSPARLDDAMATVERDRARMNELRAQLRVAQLGARMDEINAAEQEVKTAQAQLAQADWQLEQKSRRVPVAAEVADVLFREGEWVPAGSPVVSLLPPQNIKARFFVPEPQVGALRLGQDVVLQCDGCSAPVPATISYISREAEYTSPLIYSKENRASLVFMIEARPVPGQAAALHPGQPLDIRLAGKSP
ncbi:MAG: HlyD family efflux transporter periplasmic adaptor subunit [Pseudomonadota bacterium]